MSQFFFSGSANAKLDDKSRFVLPQSMRYGLVENGELKFTIALGLNGCLTIYRQSDIQQIIEKLKAKQHIAKFQKLLTLFFSTMHTTSCDKLGRVVVPSALKNAIGLEGEIVVAGVLDKIEIWPKAKYDADLGAYQAEGLSSLFEEAFSEKENTPVDTLKSLASEAHAGSA